MASIVDNRAEIVENPLQMWTVRPSRVCDCPPSGGPTVVGSGGLVDAFAGYPRAVPDPLDGIGEPLHGGGGMVHRSGERGRARSSTPSTP